MREPILGGIAQTEQGRSRPLLRAGNMNCGGCGMSNILQLLSHAIAGREIKLVIPACCGAITAAVYPHSAFDVPTILTTFASAASVATGIAWVARLNNEDTRVICLAGDGGTYDIGLATLSAAAERNESILYICYDNEIYGNTGGQRSSSTPVGASTSSTQVARQRQRRTSWPLWPPTEYHMRRRSPLPTPMTQLTKCAQLLIPMVSASCIFFRPAPQAGSRNPPWA